MPIFDITTKEFLDHNAERALAVAAVAAREGDPDDFVVVVANLDGKVPFKLFKAKAEQEGRDFDSEIESLRKEIGPDKHPTAVTTWPRAVAVQLTRVFNSRISSELQTLPNHGNATILVMHNGTSLVAERPIPRTGSA